MAADTNVSTEKAGPLYVGILFCSTCGTTAGRENEGLADKEIVETANAVKAALEGDELRTDLVDLGKTDLAETCKYDWVFNLAESIVGFTLTEYEVAERMESLGVHFTGSGSAALRVCIDKPAAKIEFKKLGFLTPDFEVYQPGDEVDTKLDFPLFVKPSQEDGSIGIIDDSIVNNRRELIQQVSRIHQTFQQAALVEEYIDGRDITASILGNGDSAIAFPLSEIVYGDPGVKKIQTFDSKWVLNTKAYQASIPNCPCDPGTDLEGRIKEISMKIVTALDCRDYTRVDFRVRGDVPYLLEVNPNPCINPFDTAFIRSGVAYGFSYSQIVNRILESSIQIQGLKAEKIKIEDSVWFSN